MIWSAIGVGIIVFYIGWYLSLTSWSRLKELGVEHNRNSTTYFDIMLGSFLLSLIVARIVWMVMNQSIYNDVPWGIFPYVRTVASIEWFAYFPWRILQLTEGVYYPVLWGLFGFFASTFIFLPTTTLARRLKIEKRGVMRRFLLKSLLGFVLFLVYFGVLTWLSLR